ncbi:hypothetical protein CB1_000958004 [Camelus ferus]|nr:hypothetical protein CB1_000958004 [Camelus ferus]
MPMWQVSTSGFSLEEEDPETSSTLAKTGVKGIQPLLSQHVWRGYMTLTSGPPPVVSWLTLCEAVRPALVTAGKAGRLPAIPALAPGSLPPAVSLLRECLL